MPRRMRKNCSTSSHDAITDDKRDEYEDGDIAILDATMVCEIETVE